MAFDRSTESCDDQTDARQPHRIHRFLAAARWGIMSAILGSTVACSSWSNHPSHKDLVEYEVETVSPGGRWVVVRGHTKKHPDDWRKMLFSTDGHRRVSLPPDGATWPLTKFSKDGNQAAWWQGTDSTGWTLWRIDLNERNPSPIETTINVSSPHNIILSPEGKRVALIKNGAISVYDLASEGLITKLRGDREMVSGEFSFLGRDRLRVTYAAHNDRLKPYAGDSTFVYDLAIENDAELHLVATFPYPRDENQECDRDFRTLVSGLKNPILGPNEIEAQRIYSIDSGNLLGYVNGLFRGFLADGRLWSISEEENGDLKVVVEHPDGEASAELGIGQPGRDILVGFVANGGLMIASEKIARGDKEPPLWASIKMIDLDTGTSRHIGRLLRPFAIRRSNLASGRSTGFHWFGSVIGYPMSAGENILFVDSDNALLGWDPKNQELVTLVGGRAHH